MKKPEPISKRALLVKLWELYLKQKRRELEFGVDPVQVDADTERMKGWFRDAAEGKLQAGELDQAFPESKVSGGACKLCAGEGWYLSDKAKFKRWGPQGPLNYETEGYVFCSCYIGRARLEAARSSKKPEKKTRI